MITLTNDTPYSHGKAVLVGAAAMTAALAGVTLCLATPMVPLLGKKGINVATRVMALFVAAIGIQFIVTGLRNQLPGLTS